MDSFPNGEFVRLIDKQFPHINLISSFDIPLITTTKLPMTIPHQPKQVKSKWYYIFWSIATLAVVLGQIYVANSYRTLAHILELNLT